MPKDKTPPETETEPTEEVDQFVEIPFKGAVFVIPKDRDDWSTEGLACLAESKYNLFVMHTLEIARPGQWKVLCRLCPRRREFSEFFGLFGQAVEGCVG